MNTTFFLSATKLKNIGFKTRSKAVQKGLSLTLSLALCAIAFFISSDVQGKPSFAPETAQSSAKTLPRFSKSFLHDSKGNLWMVQKDSGVIVYNPNTKQQHYYTEKNGLSGRHVNSILEDNTGKIWLATDDGITTYDGTAFSRIPIATIIGSYTFNYTKTQHDRNYGVSLNRENGVNCILQDSKGHFWFGLQKEICRFDGTHYTQFTVNDGVKNYTGKSFNTNYDGIESIIEDKSGRIWFGGRDIDGVFCYENGILNNYSIAGYRDWVIPIAYTRNGDVWFTNTSLLIFDGTRFKNFEQPAFRSWAMDVVEDNNGKLWFNNGENWGVTMYDGKQFINYTEKDCAHFSRRNYIRIEKDSQGVLWFYSHHGQLCKYDGKKFTVVMEGC